ncbi:anaphase promoting complex subunit 5 [Loxospora ochrophaea]|nr:anaphase promoting complex subunit 5 [Loxospora ochrophaea]
MPRYLTPSKISLLLLVSLYTDSVVPTAHTIPVLSFIVFHLNPQCSSAARVSSSNEFSSDLEIEDFRKATVSLISGIPGRTIWDLFVKKLWEINSFDSLHQFFDSLSSILVKTREEARKDAEQNKSQSPNQTLLSRTSPLGAFVRRAQLEFTRLQFHDLITLWKNFVVYREPTMSMWRKRNPNAGKNSFDTNLIEGDLGSNERLARILYGDLPNQNGEDASICTDDVEKLLEFQVDQMQRLGNRVPDVIRDRFEKMIRTGLTIPSLSHYVKFLDSWKAGDYPSSFDNLHRYFDYTMHNRDRTFYQYALLNLAILQADFGCFSEAITAMQETISTARENKDMGCLNYSLSWLYHFGKAHPKEIGEVQKSGVLGTEKEALAFLKAKAKETNMWGLLSTSLLSEAKLALTNGDSLPSAFEKITKASHLNLTKNITNSIGSQMMIQSSLFSRLGVNYLAWSYGEMFLQCYANISPVEDVLHCMCKSAYALTTKGRYDEALVVMDDVDQDVLRTLRHQQYWVTYSTLLKLHRKLHRDDLVAAQHFLSQLKSSPLPSQDISFTTLVLEIDFYIRKEDFPAAMKLLEKQATQLNNEEADIFQRVKLMILKSRIYDKAGIPQKGFSVAIRAASLAHRARLLPALWEAVGAVCRVLISLKEFDAAATLLESIMPQVLECEDCDLVAHTFSFLADAHMGLAGQAKAGSRERKQKLTKAAECIGWSFDEFSRIEDVKGQCEMMAKKATIMHLNGDLTLANDCAARYLDIRKSAKEEM